VEIIPAEIEPPKRSRAGASGYRIRIGSKPVTNAGDCADIVVAFNEQVLYSRIDAGALRPGTWCSSINRGSPIPTSAFVEAVPRGAGRFPRARLSGDSSAHRGGMPEARRRCAQGQEHLGAGTAVRDLRSRSDAMVRQSIAKRFSRKGEETVRKNIALFTAGYEWALTHVEQRFHVPVGATHEPMVVMNGNQAMALGIMASGIEVCSMYPITPATSASHFLASAFEQTGGIVHQAEDEIAAIGFAVGCSYAGKTAVTITSGPGLALKTEFIGLAVMAEIPAGGVVVQRGGPSTGLPTKVEQGDLMAALHASPGDCPKIIIAPATIEECFHFMITARKLAEEFRGPVMVLSDANLATGQQPFASPYSIRMAGAAAGSFSLDPGRIRLRLGCGNRPFAPPIPGQRGGEYVLTGLAHDETATSRTSRPSTSGR
jgi:2-oxoglutarate/2-oxoacid ferredoxin oxidoreductase subunit alpha